MKIAIDAGGLATKKGTGVYQVTFNMVNQFKKIAPENKYLIYRQPKPGWLYWYLPLKLFFDRPDVFLGLNQAMPIFCPCPAVVFVYDLAFELFPERFPDKGQRLQRITRWAVKRAEKIVCPSLSTKKDLIKIYRVPEEKIKIIYLGR